MSDVSKVRGMMKLFFCGDIMPGGVLPYQDGYITPELMEYMRGFDFRIGTLEAAIGTGLSYDPVKMKGRQNIIYARNEDFFRVKEMGFDVVSLANNHVFDLGEEGLINTMSVIDEAGIQHLGAGMNRDIAAKPVVLKKDGISVAVFAYCLGPQYLGYVEFAENYKAGTNCFEIERVKDEIIDAKKKYDFVVVMPHWGLEYHIEPISECIKYAKQMIKAGADAVLGSHPHVVQPFVRYNRGVICFSMGNFLFPDFYMQPPRPIWYPTDAEELKNVEDTNQYPFPIDRPLRRVWKPLSRYGCVVSLTVMKKGMDASVKYVCLSTDNVLGLSEISDSLKNQLHKATLLSNHSLLRHIVLLKRKALKK